MFEIYGSDRKRKFFTEYEQCIPNKTRRDELRKAGYKLYLDGKVWNERGR